VSKIAFLGLGAMGSRMATNLLKAGHDLTIWNRDAAKAAPLASAGAVLSESPRAATTGSDLVFAMVRDDEASRFVWLDPQSGALQGMPRHSVGIDCSTLTVAWVRELAQRFGQAGYPFLDAPVAGSIPQAEAAQLIFMVGGKVETLAKVEPVLRVMGAAVHHAGDNGAGAAVKLGVNALFGIQVAAIAEVIGLMSASGVDPARAVDIIGATPVASRAVKGAAASMLAGTFTPLFPVALVEKDFLYIEKTGEQVAAQVPMAAAAGRL
jgi:3-hydroxyisobutyrate dehydrogenase